MVKKILIAGVLLLFAVSYISAFCTTQGYILDENNQYLNASKINIICQRTDGNLIAQVNNMPAYGFPFGDWYDDCSYCDLGVHVIVFDDDANYFGELTNMSCISQGNKKCHSNIIIEQISEPVSSKGGYDSVANVGPNAPSPTPMPKSNITPEQTVKGIKEDIYPDYTKYYVIAGIILLIIIILVIKKRYDK